MEVRLKLHSRDLDFKLTQDKRTIKGNGLGGFLVILQKYGKIIERIDLSGRGESYTFSRQVYLAVNLLRSFSKSEVFVEGEKTDPEEILLPKYKEENDAERK